MSSASYQVQNFHGCDDTGKSRVGKSSIFPEAGITNRPTNLPFTIISFLLPIYKARNRAVERLEDLARRSAPNQQYPNDDRLSKRISLRLQDYLDSHMCALPNFYDCPLEASSLRYSRFVAEASMPATSLQHPCQQKYMSLMPCAASKKGLLRVVSCPNLQKAYRGVCEGFVVLSAPKAFDKLSIRFLFYAHNKIHVYMSFRFTSARFLSRACVLLSVISLSSKLHVFTDDARLV